MGSGTTVNPWPAYRSLPVQPNRPVSILMPAPALITPRSIRGLPLLRIRLSSPKWRRPYPGRRRKMPGSSARLFLRRERRGVTHPQARPVRAAILWAAFPVPRRPDQPAASRRRPLPRAMCWASAALPRPGFQGVWGFKRPCKKIRLPPHPSPNSQKKAPANAGASSLSQSLGFIEINCCRSGPSGVCRSSR